MRTSLFVLAAAALVAAPFAIAHAPAGTPDASCEWGLGPHDYGAPGGVLGPRVDGAEGVYCNEPVFSPTGDDHDEFAVGGAWIVARSGDGRPSADPDDPSGSLVCIGRWADHAPHGPFRVEDVSGVAGIPFRVSADTVDLTGLGGGCGDFMDDVFVDCIDACAAPFAPGLDGTYRVRVFGTAGHVFAS